MNVIFLAAGFATFVTGSSFAQIEPVLVKDTNTNPLDFSGHFGILDTAIYLGGYNLSTGYELWKSDGTSQGTALLKDLVPGPSGSGPFQFTKLGNTVFFSATTAYRHHELWKTDGTAQGTSLVKDIGSYNSSLPRSLFAWKNQLFFTAYEDGLGRNLWTSDGTELGTVKLQTMGSTFDEGVLSGYTPLGNNLYFLFTRSTSHGSKIWKTDGTSGGTISFGATLFFSPDNLTALGDTLYFSAFEVSSGKRKLWKTDGTELGTTPALKIDLGSGSFDLIKMGGDLYFTQNIGSRESLWKTDGSEANTILLATSSSFSAFSVCQLSDDAEPSLYFSGLDSANGAEMWKSDGTISGTGLFKDIIPGMLSSYPRGFQAIGNRLVFSADSNGGDSGDGLYVLSRQGNSATLLKTFRSSFFFRGIYGNEVFFDADDGASGREIWKTDGTVEGTVVLKDFMGNADSSPRGLQDLDGKLYFSAVENSGSRGSYRTDGTTVGTESIPAGSIPIGSDLYFTGVEKFSSSNWDYELWKTNSTGVSVSRIKDIWPAGSSNPSQFVKLGSFLCFIANDGIHGRELWRSDGTSEGTVLVKDVVTGSTGIDTLSFFKGANLLYFTIQIATNQKQLWRTDATEAGTFMLMQFENFGETVVVGDTLYFVAALENSPDAIWRTDGSVTGTQKSNSPSGAYPSNWFSKWVKALDGDVFFLAPNPYDRKAELWKVESETLEVTKVTALGEYSPYAMELHVIDDALVILTSLQDKIQIWSSDGTSQGAKLVRSRASGVDGIRSVTANRNAVFFILQNESLDYSLWKSDATTEGTAPILVNMPAPWNGDTTLKVAGDDLYFDLKTDRYGLELYKFPIPNLQTGHEKLSAWTESQGLSGMQSLPQATPFDDGVSNLLKYAFFMDGSRADQRVLPPAIGNRGLPHLSVTKNEVGTNILRFEYVRRKNSGMVYRPLISTTLGLESFRPTTGNSVVTEIDAERERVVIEHLVEPSEQSRCFGRVEVTMD